MTETATTGIVTFEHGGTTWVIPLDLIEAQQRFDTADAQCQSLAATSNPGADTQAAYRKASGERGDAVLALHRHPWLIEHQRARRRHQADTAMKAYVRGGQVPA